MLWLVPLQEVLLGVRVVPTDDGDVVARRGLLVRVVGPGVGVDVLRAARRVGRGMIGLEADIDGTTLQELGLNRGRRGLVVLVYLVALIVVGPACGPRQPVGVLEREVGGKAVLLVDRPVRLIRPANRLIGIEIRIFILFCLDLLGGKIIPIRGNFSFLVLIRDQTLGHRTCPRTEQGRGEHDHPTRIQTHAALVKRHVAFPRLRAGVVGQRRHRKPCGLQFGEVQAGSLVGRAEFGENRGLGGRG